MVFKNLCALVLGTKVVSVLEGLGFFGSLRIRHMCHLSRSRLNVKSIFHAALFYGKGHGYLIDESGMFPRLRTNHGPPLVSGTSILTG